MRIQTYLLTLFGIISVMLPGCGSHAGGVNQPQSATVLEAPVLTSVTASGTSAEPSTVIAEVSTGGMAPVVIADSDSDPLAWSLTSATPAGETAIVITATDRTGNVRTLTTLISVP